MFNNYLIIFIFCKDNNVSIVYLIPSFEILSAKTIKNNIALF